MTAYTPAPAPEVERIAVLAWAKHITSTPACRDRLDGGTDGE